MDSFHLEEKGDKFAQAALVLGIISIFSAIFLFWTFFIPLVTGGLAIIFALLSKSQGKKISKKSKLGLILGIIGSVLLTTILTTMIASTIYRLRNDEAYRNEVRESLSATEDMMESMYGEEFMDQYKELYGDDFSFENTFDQLFGE